MIGKKRAIEIEKRYKRWPKAGKKNINNFLNLNSVFSEKVPKKDPYSMQSRNICSLIGEIGVFFC